ncbi:MAG: folate-binding protein [Terriglobales bacterium]
MTQTTQTVPRTALTEKLAARGARLAPYAGVEAAASFGNTDQEFIAITTGCGVYDLGWRAKIRVTGEDRFRWLNGMVTNNIKDLAEKHGNYNFVLSAQGRILGDLYIYNRGADILLDTERSQAEPLLKVLNHFIIMDDVELTDISDELTSIGVQGPEAEAMLKKVGIVPDCADPLVICNVEWNGQKLALTRMANPDYLTYEIWLSPQTAPGLWDALVSARALPVGTDALEKFRVMAGVPRYGVDVTERYLPQETNQETALNFTKGCYIGQEIVERIRARGQVHRTLTGFVLDAEVERGAKISVGGKDLGEVTSVARVRPPKAVETINRERVLALGYIRREAEKPGTPVEVGGVPGVVASLPFKF